ncbi:Asp23/Gls24 family envelope stress response protein [Pseudonocardia sp. GCM10023141]|uniref:Asp23/Gls24 family envelope stress response protein n=1 Tax=Pseudonocardia sp. GCM10023141 TaxID=3252653 RepID=UPI00360C97A7
MAMNADDAPNPSGLDDPAREHGLPCGRTVEAVWTELEEQTTSEHGVGCPHCTTVRASLTQLMEATRLLVDDPIEPPAGMMERIMDAVRADLGRSSSIPLPTPSGLPPALGGIDISTSALAAVLRYAVDGVDGVRAQRCRVELDPDRPYTVLVTMSVSLRYSASGADGRVELLDEARTRVRAAIGEQVGLRIAALDIEVADVWTDPASDAR